MNLQTDRRAFSPMVVTAFDSLIDPGESRESWMLRNLEDFGDTLAYLDQSFIEGGLNAVFCLLALENNTWPSMVANQSLLDIFVMFNGHRRPCEVGLLLAVDQNPGGVSSITSPRYGYSRDSGFFYTHSERINTEVLAEMCRTRQAQPMENYTVRFADALGDWRD